MESLAVKYRPQTFMDVEGQSSIKEILQNQLNTNNIRHAYLFCGSAGTGKTTCARLFGKELNQGKGNIIEMDAASNSGVDNVRDIIAQAQTKSLSSEYKVFIIDECHSLSNTAWQALLKLIEEPPAKTIFIFCTTDPQKIPATILSRVQRYNFQKLSLENILNRLTFVIGEENKEEANITYEDEALYLIGELADGGMRDALTLLDKCIAFNKDLTTVNITSCLGISSGDEMLDLIYNILTLNTEQVVKGIEQVANSGRDLKLFIRHFFEFVINANLIYLGVNGEYVKMSKYIQDQLSQDLEHVHSYYCNNLHEETGAFIGMFLAKLMRALRVLNNDIKWDTKCQPVIIGQLLEYMIEVQYKIDNVNWR